MATTVDELQVLIGANAGGFQQELQKVQKQLSKFSTGFNGMSAKMATTAVAVGNIISQAFTTAFSAISSELSNAVSRLDTLNNYGKVMSNLGISSSDAEKSIQILNQGILGLPTSLDAAALATQRLTATNGNIAASTDMFLALNNAILAGGASTETQATALEQMMQAYSKGKPDAVEWRAFLTAMPAQLKQVAEQMGYTSTAIGGDLQSALVNGEVSMNDFMVAIMKLNENGINGLPSFAEQAKNAVSGVATSIKNLKLAIQRGMANIMNVIGQTNISGFINKIASAVDTVSYYIAGFVSLIKQAVAWIQVLFGKSAGSTDKLVTATSSAASSTGAIASNASEASENLDDATGSAKKLSKQLASFDEMNTLKESESSGGSSSSGGGDATISDYSWADNNLSGLSDKVAEYAEKIKTALASMFDIEVIKSAIAQFVADLQVFLDPVVQIIKDIWNDYVLPIVSWSGNSLLPAVLNAIGGALSFIGSILKSYWNKFLKPFIDDFLAPIAKWTGGKIVKVLNAIGDGLRELSKREDVINVFTKIAGAITAASAAIVAWNTAATFMSGVMGTVLNIGTGLPTLLENTRIGMLGITAGSTAFNAIATPLTTIITGLKTAFSSLWTVISAHPLLAIAAVVAALMLTNEEFRQSLMNLLTAVLEPLMGLLNVIIGLIQPILDLCINLLSVVLTPIIEVINLLAIGLSYVINFLSPIINFIAQIAEGIVALPLLVLNGLIEGLNYVLGVLMGLMEGLFGWLGNLLGITNENTTANENNKKSLSDLEAQYDSNGDGALDYAERIVYLNKCINDENTAEEDLIQAERDQIETMRTLQEFVEKYNMTADELIQMHREGRLSELAQGEALDDLRLAVIDVEQANYKVNEAQEKYTNAQGEAQSQANQLKEEYDDLGQKLVDLASESGFVDNEFDVQAAKLQEIQEEIKKTGKNVGELKNWYGEALEAGMKLGQGLEDGMTCKVPGANQVGQDLGQGLINGANSKSGSAWNAGYSLGQNLVSGLRAGTDSHSPSKAAREIGGFVGQGLVLGMEDEEAPVEKAAKNLGEVITDSLEPLSNFSIELPDVSAASFGVQSNVEMPEEFGEDAEPVHVTVKVGEDTLVNKIVNGINDLSYLSNRTVINV